MVKKSDRMKRFISEFTHSTHLKIQGFIKERSLPTKTLTLFLYLVNVAFTGLLAYYAIHHLDHWTGIGVFIAMSVYYIEWFVNIIKKKQ